MTSCPLFLNHKSEKTECLIMYPQGLQSTYILYVSMYLSCIIIVSRIKFNVKKISELFNEGQTYCEFLSKSMIHISIEPLL